MEDEADSPEEEIVGGGEASLEAAAVIVGDEEGSQEEVDEVSTTSLSCLREISRLVELRKHVCDCA